VLQTISSILSQHAENAAFLWQLRSQAVAALHYSLGDLARLDLRGESNLDGLRIARDAGWEICKKALADGESGDVFVAAVLAFESGNKDRIETVQKVGTASPELSDGLISALGWLAFPQAQPFIQQFLASPSAAEQRVGIAASAVHRQNPGRALLNAISSPDPPLRSRALRAVGELGLLDLLPQTRQHLTDTDDRCRFEAAWSAALLSGDADAISILTHTAESKLAYHETALIMAIRCMERPDATAWKGRLSGRAAIIAAGAFGDPAHISGIIDRMNTPELARVAGEAFTMITGVDIGYEDLDRSKPEGFESGPTENPEDQDVEMDPDEHLAWPDPQLITKWWAQHQGRFDIGTRYLLGKPISIDWCEQVLRIGRQRQRAAAALELAIRRPGQPLFNVAAPGFRQQQVLGVRRS
jgi:uncharacterized protein (TIGR02270 family)